MKELKDYIILKPQVIKVRNEKRRVDIWREYMKAIVENNSDLICEYTNEKIILRKYE